MSRRVGLGLAGLGVGLLGYVLIASSGLTPDGALPPVTELARTAGVVAGEDRFWQALADTVTTWWVGFGRALLIGLAAGLLLGSSRRVWRVVAPVVDFARPVPSVAFVPVVVLLWGVGQQSCAMLAMYAALWPVLLQVVAGVQDVDAVAGDTGRSLRLGPLRRLTVIVWPTLLPHLVTGARLAASVALVVTVAGELVIGGPGLGSALARASSSGAYPRVYVLVAACGLLGLLVNLALTGASRVLLRHHPPALRAVAA